MITIQQHFKKLKPAHRDAALSNMEPKGMITPAIDIASALKRGFDWDSTPQGHAFWGDICRQLTRGEYTFTEKESKRQIFPENDEERQKYPLAQTALFFSVADAEFSKFCLTNQQKHCPDATKVIWAENKSVGDGSQLLRHIIEFLQAVKDRDWEKADREAKALDWRGRELSERWHTRMPPFNNLLDK